MFGINLGVVASQAQSDRYLLDLHPNTDGEVWSLYQESSTFTGDVITIKRADTTTQSFAFDSGELPMASIASFVGAGDGLVTSFIGQANGLDLTQSNNAEMPKLFESGVLVEENGHPALKFSGAQWLTAGDVLGANEQPFLGVAVAKASGDDETIYAKAKFGAAADRISLISDNSLLSNKLGNNVSKSFTSTTAQAIYNQVFNSASKNEVFLNDVSQGSSANPSTVGSSTFEFLVGAYNNAAGGDGSVLFFNGTIQFIGIWLDGTAVSNRSAINTIINNRLSIY